MLRRAAGVSPQLNCVAATPASIIGGGESMLYVLVCGESKFPEILQNASLADTVGEYQALDIVQVHL